MLGMQHVLLVSLAMLALGAVGLMVRRNALVMFMSVELVLNAGNLNFIGFSRFLPDPVGNIFSVFIIVVAAAEVAVGLAIVLSLYRNRDSVMADEASEMKG
ncbi:MAG TPA: NADH-quinone oxidoreductase subunit NuoK [Acidobacteriota bacterium]|nr:NADH-quinone oxidoreductase subunit NuoK [Acidobacteriota bacterium]